MISRWIVQGQVICKSTTHGCYRVSPRTGAHAPLPSTLMFGDGRYRNWWRMHLGCHRPANRFYQPHYLFNTERRIVLVLSNRNEGEQKGVADYPDSRQAAGKGAAANQEGVRHHYDIKKATITRSNSGRNCLMQ